MSSIVSRQPNVEISERPDGSVIIKERSLLEGGDESVLFANGNFTCGVFNKNDSLVDGVSFNGHHCDVVVGGQPKYNYIPDMSKPDVLKEAVIRTVNLMKTLLRAPPPPPQHTFSREPTFDSVYLRRKTSHERILSNLVSEENSQSNAASDLREEVAHTASPDCIFSCASPCATEVFSAPRFSFRLLAFLFPFFSLPGLPTSFYLIDSLDTERAFVVSGASLQRSFDSPGVSMYIIAVGLLCSVASLVLYVVSDISTGPFQEGKLSESDVVVPFVLWVVNAIVCACYFSFVRCPHGLERMNRELTVELTALAAGVVDSQSSICIYSWDEAGRDKVKNIRFRWKWLMLSLFNSAIIACTSPAARAALSGSPIGQTGSEKTILSFSITAKGFFASIISYYAFKCMDVQREVASKLSVLTKIAYIEGSSLMAPALYLKEHFRCDAVFDPSRLMEGFQGWFCIRSLVLCASPIANHRSRWSALSILVICVCTSCVRIFFYSSEWNWKVEKSTFDNLLCNLVAVNLTWGVITIQYLNVCAATRSELRRHLYIMDIVSLYHLVKHKDTAASNTVRLCRDAVESHDMYPELLNIRLIPVVSWSLILMTFVAIAFSLLWVIRFFLII